MARLGVRSPVLSLWAEARTIPPDLPEKRPGKAPRFVRIDLPACGSCRVSPRKYLMRLNPVRWGSAHKPLQTSLHYAVCIVA